MIAKANFKKSEILVSFLLSFCASHVWATELDCRRGAHFELVTIESNLIRSSFVSVGSGNVFPWSGRESVFGGSEINRSIEALQLGVPSDELKSLDDASRFTEFVRDESAWYTGARQAKLYVERGLLQNELSGVIILVGAVVVNDVAKVTLMECSKRLP